jgi:hypothetical protein
MEAAMKTEFLIIPTDEQLKDPSTWRKRGNTYSVVRTHLMIVHEYGTDVKKGPMLEGNDYPAGAQVTNGFKVTYSIKITDEVTRAVETTIAKRINREIASTLKSGMTAKVPGAGTSLQSELHTRVGVELSESLREGLTEMRRIETEKVVEDSTTVTITLSEDSRITVYMMLRPAFWNVYLIRADSMTLQWEDEWYWPTVRKTMETQVDEKARPLFRLAVYEPQAKASMTLKPHVPEINESSFVEVLPLDGAVPRRKIEELTPLRLLAREAFPTTVDKIKAAITRKGKGRAKSSAPKSGSKRSGSEREAASRSRSSSAKKASAATSRKAASRGSSKARPKSSSAKRPASKELFRGGGAKGGGTGPMT